VYHYAIRSAFTVVISIFLLIALQSDCKTCYACRLVLMIPKETDTALFCVLSKEFAVIGAYLSVYSFYLGLMA